MCLQRRWRQHKYWSSRKCGIKHLNIIRSSQPDRWLSIFSLSRAANREAQNRGTATTRRNSKANISFLHILRSFFRSLKPVFRATSCCVFWQSRTGEEMPGKASGHFWSGLRSCIAIDKLLLRSPHCVVDVFRRHKYFMTIYLLIFHAGWFDVADKRN